MSYYYSYPYGGPAPTPVDPYWRYQNPNMGVNPSTVEPPYPSGSPITPSTPTEPGQVPQYGSATAIGGFQLPVGNLLTMAQGSSYVSNILRLNRGKLATVYMTFSGNDATLARKTFIGIIEAAGRDHIILSDPNTGHRFVLLTVYLDYVEFPEEINYYYPMDNTINIVDPDLFEKFPSLGALYNYQEAQNELYKQQNPNYNVLPQQYVATHPQYAQQSQQNQYSNQYTQQNQYNTESQQF